MKFLFILAFFRIYIKFTFKMSGKEILKEIVIKIESSEVNVYSIVDGATENF